MLASHPDSEFPNPPDLATRIVNSADHPLLGRPAASIYYQVWQASEIQVGYADAVKFVRQHPEFSVRDCVDVFMADQHLRWSRGHEISCEVYLKYLHQRFDGPLLCETAEIVCHEFALALAWSPRGEEPNLDDYIVVFPELTEALQARFGQQIAPGEGTSTTDVSGPNATDHNNTPTVINPPCSVASDTHVDSKYESWSDNPPTVIDEGGSRDSPLAKVRPFSQLPIRVLSMLDQQVERVSFGVGDSLIRQGEPGTGLFVLQAGSVEIVLTDSAGQTQVLGTSHPGEVLGEMALLTDEPRTATVMAIRPVLALFLPKAAFERVATSHPIVSRMLTLLLADRLGQQGRDALTGKVLAGYRILNRLGKGGMAIVYQAEELATGRMVALKMMSHRLVYDARALLMFENEARVIRSFDHPNIVKMHGRFEAFRSYFLVMEFCEGVSLEEIVRQVGPLSEPEFRRVIGQMAKALDYAHSRQIVHRDVKPSNIMLSDDGLVKLMDFGLANPVEDQASDQRTISGTLQYMAPEQLRGDLIDQRVDIFALGCTAYRLLTGELLIQSRTVAGVREAHENWSPPQLANQPSDIASFLLQSLQADPAARYVDLKEIASWADA